MSALIKIDEEATEARMLTAFAKAEVMLSELTSLDDVKAMDDQAEALQHWLEKSKAGLEVQCQAAVFRLWAKRRIGELLGTDVKPGDGGMGRGSPRGEAMLKSERHRYRSLARIEESDFRAEIERRRLKALANDEKIRLLTPRNLLASLARGTNSRAPAHSPIIKPSDNWNFYPVAFPRLDDEGYGYIPGDLYANILWYYSLPDDLVYCPMAGSGQILRVWDERERWMRPDTWNLTLITADLTPRGPYQDRIAAGDITEGSVVARADLIIMDLPYFGMVNGQYSRDDRDLANAATVAEWQAKLERIATVCRLTQAAGGRVVTVCPQFVDWSKRRRVLLAEIVKAVFRGAGYTLVDLAYSTRRIQQEQTPTMARMNVTAKDRRLLLSDMAEVAVFEVPL